MYNFEQMLQIAANITGWVKHASGFVDPRTFCLISRLGHHFLRWMSPNNLVLLMLQIINQPRFEHGGCTVCILFRFIPAIGLEDRLQQKRRSNVDLSLPRLTSSKSFFHPVLQASQPLIRQNSHWSMVWSLNIFNKWRNPKPCTYILKHIFANNTRFNARVKTQVCWQVALVWSVQKCSKRQTREKQRKRANLVVENLTYCLMHRLKSLIKTHTHQKQVLSPRCQECFCPICYDVGTFARKLQMYMYVHGGT